MTPQRFLQGLQAVGRVGSLERYGEVGKLFGLSFERRPTTDGAAFDLVSKPSWVFYIGYSVGINKKTDNFQGIVITIERRTLCVTPEDVWAVFGLDYKPLHGMSVPAPAINQYFPQGIILEQYKIPERASLSRTGKNFWGFFYKISEMPKAKIDFMFEQQQCLVTVRIENFAVAQQQ